MQNGSLCQSSITALRVTIPAVASVIFCAAPVKLITGRIEALFVEEDVSFVQWVILMNLRDGLRMTSAELCQHLCHDSGALTRVIDQMEERGLIRRKRSTKRIAASSRWR